MCRPGARVQGMGSWQGNERVCLLDSRVEVVLGDGRSFRDSITWRIPGFMCMLYTCVFYARVYYTQLIV